VVFGDLDEPDTVSLAVVGVETVFLLSPLVESALRRTEAFLAAAIEAGVRRVVRVSGMGAQTGPDLLIARAQREAEQLVEDCGLAWCHLRPNTFMTNFLTSAASIAREGALYAPAGSGAISLVDPSDVAAVAAHVLTTEGHDGRAYEITGPTALTHHQVAETLAAATEHPVTYVDVSDEPAREAMIEQGVSPWYADRLISFYQGLRSSSYWATVTSTVEQLTGQAPRNFSDWANENAGAFTAAVPGSSSPAGHQL
jgi:uncharacterized protein YbjT (DUF2867 family)